MRIKLLIGALALSLLSGCGGQGGHADPQAGDKNAPRSSAKTGASPETTASAASYSTVVEQLYLAYFGRPADAQGLANFESQLAAAAAPSDIQQLARVYPSNATVRALIDSFGTSAESAALYGSGTTSDFVTAIFKNVVGRAPAQAGLDFWVSAIDSGSLSKGDAALSIMAGALSNTSPQGLQDAILVDNRIAVATLFSAGAGASPTLAGYSGSAAAATVRGLLSSVTAAIDPSTFQSLATTALRSIARYSVSGTVAGLNNGTSITMTDGQGGQVTIESGAGTFQFPYTLADGVSYSITVGTLPDGETCTVAGGAGTTGLAALVNVAVSCVTMHVYITDFYDNNVRQYAIGLGGNLQAMATPSVPTTDQTPAAITTDPAHKYVFVSNVFGNSVDEYTYGADGGLVYARKLVTAAGQYPGAVVVDPSDSHFYFPAVTFVYQYNLSSDGSFTLLDGGLVATPNFPFGFVLTPDGKFAYTSNLDASIVSQYQIGADGGLVPLSKATFPLSEAYGIFMHPSGKFVYVLDVYNNVHQFAVGSDGNLTPLAVPSVSGGSSVVSMAFSPDGSHAYVVNINGNSNGAVNQFTVGTDGSLSPMAVPSVTAGSQPTTLVIDPTGRYAYLGYLGGTVVGQYLIGSDGSLTPAKVPTATTGSGPRQILIH